MTGFEIGSLVVSSGALIGAALAIWFTHKQFKANIDFSKKQSKAIIEHNKLSILPMLDTHVDTHTNKNTNIDANYQKTIIITIIKTVVLQNNGSGTAVIKKISLFIDNKMVDNENPMGRVVEKILKDCSVEGESLNVFTLGKKGRGLLSGDNITLIKLEFSGEPNVKDEKMFDSFDIKIDYESLDGKKYTYLSK